MNSIRVFCLVLACTFSMGASAQVQWQWLDKDGRKVFSDRAPPPDVPDNRILRRPGGAAPMPTATSSPAPSASAPSAPTAQAASAPKLNTRDAQLEAKKKQAEDEQKAKAKAAEDDLKKRKAENCTQARKGMDLLKSGVRLRQANAKGELEVLDDEQRAAETKRVQQIIDSECK